jgi:3-hydroxyacyl-CoA dehydrogenase
VEVKIGVQRTPREIVLESTQSPDEVEAAVRDALKDPSGVLALVDEKGRRVVVPSALIAYVEIADADHRRVGFAVN